MSQARTRVRVELQEVSRGRFRATREGWPSPIMRRAEPLGKEEAPAVGARPGLLIHDSRNRLPIGDVGRLPLHYEKNARSGSGVPQKKKAPGRVTGASYAERYVPRQSGARRQDGGTSGGLAEPSAEQT